MNILQFDAQDCGPACITVVAAHYGLDLDIEQVRKLCDFTSHGTSIYDLSKAAEYFGFQTLITHIEIAQLDEANYPFICWWNQNHFIVVNRSKKGRVYVSDPGVGNITYSHADFQEKWAVDDNKGYILLLEPTLAFNQSTKKKNESNKSLQYYLSYLKTFKRYYWLVAVILVSGILLQFLLPFLSQTVIDQGLALKNLQLINVILIAQLVIQLSQLITQFIRSWLYQHIGMRASLRTVSNYLLKLLRLPISFFATRKVGDIIQRIDDNRRIQTFITGVFSETLFGMLTLLIFSVVLCIYNWALFAVFATGSVIYVGWIIAFQKQRRKLDIALFDKNSESRSRIIEIIESAQEIKLNNIEQKKRWEWEKLQVSIFKNQQKSLYFSQIQSTGAFFINEIKNIILSYMAASAVVRGQITLGEMVSVQYIIGQLNLPINRLVDFFQQYLMSNLSINRLLQIFQTEEVQNVESILPVHPADQTISIQNLNFSYSQNNNSSNKTLDNITMNIRSGNITAIVGESGSGKSTLLKLLLKLYTEYNGNIKVGGVELSQIENDWWRDQCSSVLQDSYIFSESVLYNVCLADKVDYERLMDAVDKANIKQFIETLPLGYNTRIGKEGIGVSQGQKQRILLARAIYRNTKILLLDEATNALDSQNEKAILDNLSDFYKGKTVVVVAHRLSTVRNANMIYVMKKGKIIEYGNHNYLIGRQGYYFNLVKNQLELSN